MFCMIKKKNTSCLSFKTKLNREKQFILLMIPNGEKRVLSKTLATQAKSKGR